MVIEIFVPPFVDKKNTRESLGEVSGNQVRVVPRSPFGVK
jgi:hypothetical protein